MPTDDSLPTDDDAPHVDENHAYVWICKNKTVMEGETESDSENSSHVITERKCYEAFRTVFAPKTVTTITSLTDKKSLYFHFDYVRRKCVLTISQGLHYFFQ